MTLHISVHLSALSARADDVPTWVGAEVCPLPWLRVFCSLEFQHTDDPQLMKGKSHCLKISF